MRYQAAVTLFLLGRMACSALAFDISEEDIELICKHDHHPYFKFECEHYRPVTVGTTQVSNRTFTTVMPNTLGVTPRTEPARFILDVTTAPTTTSGHYRVTSTTRATTSVGYALGKDLVKFTSVEDITTAGTTPSTSTIPPASISSPSIERGGFSTPYMNVFLVGIVVAVAGFLIYRYAGRAGMALVNCHLNKANRATVRGNNGLMSV